MGLSLLVPCLLTLGTAFLKVPDPDRQLGLQKSGEGKAQGAVPTFGSVRAPHHWSGPQLSQWTHLGALNIPPTCWGCSPTTYPRVSGVGLG